MYGKPLRPMLTSTSRNNRPFSAPLQHLTRHTNHSNYSLHIPTMIHSYPPFPHQLWICILPLKQNPSQTPGISVRSPTRHSIPPITR